jgi:hypothetical protein
LDKSHSVFPPEIHDVVDPYLNKIEQRLNPNFQPHAPGSHGEWPSQAQSQSPGGWPQVTWPALPSPPQQSGSGWPYSSGAQSGRSSQSQSFEPPSGRDPYSVPREPNPFPGPYSAEIPVSRDY